MFSNFKIKDESNNRIIDILEREFTQKNLKTILDRLQQEINSEEVKILLNEIDEHGYALIHYFAKINYHEVI